MEINREELAWAAGFFDGEGCVMVNKSGRGVYGKICVNQAGNHATALLNRFNIAVGSLGNIVRYSGPLRDNWSPRWDLTIHGQEKVQAVCAMLWNFLGPRKREQFYTVVMAMKRHHESECNHTCAMRKQWANPEFRNNMSAKFTGIGNPFYGRKHTEETKRKILETKKRNLEMRLANG